MSEGTRRPIADVRVILYSLGDGVAEVEIAIDPEGELKGAYGTGEERFEALQKLFEAVQRELGDALDTLVAEGQEGANSGDAPGA